MRVYMYTVKNTLHLIQIEKIKGMFSILTIYVIHIIQNNVMVLSLKNINPYKL